ncbi:MAG: hypothetical protein LBC74_07345 [Planctomycetaceae bacterium]|nr:hypothetical protein [Planctomycetaceae bacterium]
MLNRKQKKRNISPFIREYCISMKRPTAQFFWGFIELTCKPDMGVNNLIGLAKFKLYNSSEHT